MIFARSAAMRPSASTASSPSQTEPRAWFVVIWSSPRVAIHFTGTPSRRASHPSSTSSRYGPGLDAEAAAHVGRDHPHPRLGQIEEPRDLGPNAEGRLAGRPERQLLGGRVEGGEDGARLHRHGREPLLDHADRDRARRARDSARGVALAQRAREAPVPRDLGVERGRALGHRALRLGQRRQRLVRDVDQVAGVARGVDTVRHHGGHRHAGGVDDARRR